MKKIFLITAFAIVMMLTSCTQPEAPDLLTPAAPQSTDTPGSRAINDIFKLESTGDFWGTENKVDFQGNLYSLRDALCYDLNQKELFNPPFYKIKSFLSDNNCLIVDWCFDNKGNIIVVAEANEYCGRVYMFPPDMNSMVDLTSYFPSNLYVYGVCAAENGNIFVCAGDSKTDYFSSQTRKIYRLNADNGVVKEVVSGIKNNLDYFYFNPDKKILMKMKGAFIGGFSGDGGLFKANTNTGEIEYITPRLGLCYRAATNMPNFYTIDNYRIIEIRPNMTTDLVVGTIPRSYIDEDGITYSIGISDLETVYVNADATVFYAKCYKLSLQ